MSVNRKLPFGYEMRMGQIFIQEQEAAIVRTIYADYAGGSSYRQITEHLNGQPIPYNTPGKAWNKNMVARILGSNIYVGVDPYPQIISRETQQCVSAVRPKTGTPTDDGRLSKAIRQVSECAACGARPILSATNRAWERWNCPCCRQLTAQVTTPRIKEELTMLLRIIQTAPQLIQKPPSQQSEQTVASQMETRFEQMLNTPDFSEDAAQTMALDLAAARFNALSSEDYETMRIQYILAKSEPGEGLNIGLLRQIAAAVLIHPNGEVSLKLKNGQIIEKE